jgi:hypothetical protein
MYNNERERKGTVEIAWKNNAKDEEIYNYSILQTY